MAIYHFTAKMISRGKGQSAIAAAAYRSGEKLRDEQTGELKFYPSRSERIAFTALMAPSGAPEWAYDRNRLWNEAERAERRKDAQLAREIEVSLPHELTEQQREWLVKDFAREAFVRRGYAVDIAIHAPDKESDARNHHAHLLVTRRQLGPEGFSAKKDWKLDKTELAGWREQWANLANRHLERYGHTARIDHRSLKAQGVDREPGVHLGYAANEMSRRGAQSDRMDRLKEVIEQNDIKLEKEMLDFELKDVERVRDEAAARPERERREAALAAERKQQEAARRAEVEKAQREQARLTAEREQQEAARRAEAEAREQARQAEIQRATERAAAVAAQERQEAARHAAAAAREQARQVDIQKAAEQAAALARAQERAEAQRRLEAAAKADERALREPVAKDYAAQAREQAQSVRQERREEQARDAQAGWRLGVENRQAERSAPQPVERGLQVVDRATGAVSRLGDFVTNLLAGAPQREPDKRDMRAFVTDPQARKQAQLARLAAQEQAGTAEKALENVAAALKKGQLLSAEDIRNLTRAQQEQIRHFGDDGVRAMVQDAQKWADKYWKGQERERERD